MGAAVLILSLATCGVSLLANWLVGSRRVAGFWLGLFNQPAWAALGILTEAYGLVAMSVVFAAVYIRNIRRWKEASHGMHAR